MFRHIKWICGVFAAVVVCTAVTLAAPVKLGIDVLKESQFEALKGKRVGILTHQAGVDSNQKPTWQILLEEPSLNLKAIFAPEHGLFGKFAAGEEFHDDVVQGLNIYAMYGLDAKPKAEWLKDLDVVVIDLQDIGVRYYTYVSSMIYMMIACFEANIEVVVLDRPNPLGGHIVGGPAVGADLCSFLGTIAGMPLIHGMTIGEIANYVHQGNMSIKAYPNRFRSEYVAGIEATAELLKNGKLTIIPMQISGRDFAWYQTGLKWTPTSPRIPNEESAYDYGALSLLIPVSCGIYPCSVQFIFMVNEYRYFGQISNLKTQAIFTHNPMDFFKTEPASLSLRFMQESRIGNDWDRIEEEVKFFAMQTFGDRELAETLFRGDDINVDYFLEKWCQQAAAFRAKVQPYLLY